MMGSYPFGAKDANGLTIAFSSLNGYWNERLHLRRIDGKWHQASSEYYGADDKAGNASIHLFRCRLPRGQSAGGKRLATNQATGAALSVEDRVSGSSEKRKPARRIGGFERKRKMKRAFID